MPTPTLDLTLLRDRLVTAVQARLEGIPYPFDVTPGVDAPWGGIGFGVWLRGGEGDATAARLTRTALTRLLQGETTAAGVEVGFEIRSLNKGEDLLVDVTMHSEE